MKKYATIMSRATRTLLFGIFVQAGTKLTAPQVVRLARPLGISASNAKSHLSRLVAEGALHRSGPARRARYWVAESQAAVVEGIAARLRPSAERWKQTWLVLTLALPAHRTQREWLRASLWFDGFRPVAPGTVVRPAWPERWARERAQHYLGRVPGMCVQGALVGHGAPEVATLYRLDELDREAWRLARWIRARRAPARSPERAFALRLEVGGKVARFVGHDPRLPPELWGGRTGMREFLRAFQEFEERIAPAAQRFLAEVIGCGKGS